MKGTPTFTELPTRTVEKVWGREILPEPFSNPNGNRIGEIWFKPAAPCMDILIKYLFTSEKLSVQVHPSDAQAPAGHNGKEECWLVLDAEPGATLAIGFKEPVSQDAMRQAALDGSIEHMLEWYPAKRGDFFYIPAGTVHAIGPGLSLVEIQQNSDITYRLFDYGRPRELHLDEGIAVATGTPHDPHLRRSISMQESVRLVSGPYFSVDLVVGDEHPSHVDHWDGPALLLPLLDTVTVGDKSVLAGTCGVATSLASARFSPQGSALIVQSIGHSAR